MAKPKKKASGSKKKPTDIGKIQKDDQALDKGPRGFLGAVYGKKQKGRRND